MPFLSSGPARITYPSLEEEAKSRTAAGYSESFLWIVPNRVAQRRMEWELAVAARGRALSKLNILTLADLAGILAASAFSDLKLIGDAESAVLIELSIRELLGERKLAFFERAAAGSGEAFPIPRGTFELVVNTIRQLKESGVSPADIEHDLQRSQRSKGETTEMRRAADILRIYEAYQLRLRDRFMDTYGQILLVNERYDRSPEVISHDFRISFPGVTDVFVSGFFYLEPPSIALISRIATIEELSITIELEESKENPDLFSGLIDLESRLLGCGFEIVDREISKASLAGSGRAMRHPLDDHIGHHLFRSSDETIERRKAPEIQLSSAYDPVGEVEEIARRIKLLYHSSTSVREDLSRIVVATPSVEVYTPLVQEVFRRHEIPVQIADRYHLDRSPLVLALLTLLDMARTGLRKRELLRVLSSPYFAFDHEGSHAFDARNLLDVLSRYRPSGDAAAMTQSLNAQLAQTQTRKEESADSQEYARQCAEENRILHAIGDMDSIAKLLRPLAVDLTPTEFCHALRGLLTELHTPDQLLATSAVTIAAGTLELDTRAYRALAKLLEDLESLFHLMGIAEEKRTLAYYEHRLKAALILSRFSPRPRPRAVLVTSLAQSFSQPAEYLFIAGLNEGTFPSPYQPQVFLTNTLQKGERKQLLEERVLFYQAVTNFEKRLYLSYPKKGIGGGTLNRSSFLDVLDEVLEIETAQKSEGIFSYRDLYLKADRLQPSILESLANTHPSEAHIRTLTEQVPRASEAVRARLKQEDSIFRGVVDPALLLSEERDDLERNQSRVWSVTQLERYATCPFHFFAHDMLALGETEETDEGLDARDRGSALHEILREFLISRRERKLPPIQDIPEQDLAAAYIDVRAIAEEHFQSIANDHPFWRLDSERLLSDDQPGGSVLWKFIKRERELVPFEVRPKFFEVSFGGAGRAPKTPTDPILSRDTPIEFAGFRLRGKIDRIDVGGDAFTVIDYKSGKHVPTRPDIERGLSLQLPLYLRVADDLLRSHMPELKGVAALYHKVLDKDSDRKLGIAIKSYAEVAFEKIKGKNGYVDSPEKLAEIIEATIAKAKTYVDGVAAGHFPLTEADLTKQCKYCPYGIGLSRS